MIVTRYMLSACFFSAFVVTATPIHTPTQRLPRVLPGLPSDSLSVRDTPVSATLPSAIQVRDASEANPLHTPTRDDLIIPVEARITGELERRTGDSGRGEEYDLEFFQNLFTKMKAQKGNPENCSKIMSQIAKALSETQRGALSEVHHLLINNREVYKKVVSGWPLASEWEPSSEQEDAIKSILRWEEELMKLTLNGPRFKFFKDEAEQHLEQAMRVTQTDLHPEGDVNTLLSHLAYRVLDISIGEAQDLYERLLNAAFHVEVKWIVTPKSSRQDITENLQKLKRYSVVFGTRPQPVVPS
ncbi:hypothetical protein H0H93_010419 [Arthromyces matolae]|nr:hypothetical protein H0H93_010419 [Arthromyces matolae]